MTTAKQTTALETFAQLTALETELGVPEKERATLPKSFNRYRKPERFEALTAEFEALAAVCREALKTRAAARALAPIVRATELEAARKRCLRQLANLDRLRRKAGMKPVERVSLKGRTLEELTRLEAEYTAAAKATLELVPPPAPKPEQPARAKAPTTYTPVKVVETKADDVEETERAIHSVLELVYARAMERLRGLDRRAASRAFHPVPARISTKNLRALIERALDAISEIEDAAKVKEAEANEREKARENARIKADVERAKRETERKLAAKREDFERAQKSLAKYLAHQRSGRASKPYGVWLNEQRAS